MTYYIANNNKVINPNVVKYDNYNDAFNAAWELNMADDRGCYIVVTLNADGKPRKVRH